MRWWPCGNPAASESTKGAEKHRSYLDGWLAQLEEFACPQWADGTRCCGEKPVSHKHLLSLYSVTPTFKKKMPQIPWNGWVFVSFILFSSIYLRIVCVFSWVSLFLMKEFFSKVRRPSYWSPFRVLPSPQIEGSEQEESRLIGKRIRKHGLLGSVGSWARWGGNCFLLFR